MNMHHPCNQMMILLTLFSVVLASNAYCDHDAAESAYNKGDYKKAFKEYSSLAEQGDAWAQCFLGQMYEKGEGVKANYAEAAKWYHKSADQGDSGAQFKVGLSYYTGEHMPANYAEALNWFLKSGDHGFYAAQHNLGQMYELGQGVPPDYAEALKWYQKAADQGFSASQCSIGTLYFSGRGLSQNYSQAANWFRKAADQGFATAQFKLGILYYVGQGVPKDYFEALRWWRKAADQGHAEAQNVLKEYSTQNALKAYLTEIPLEKHGGVYELPVKINGVLTLNFILDTGASEVLIPADVALTLLRTGTISSTDFLPGKTYRLADGSIVESSRLILRELEIGGVKVCQVPASIGSAEASLLLGQSFLASTCLHK